MRHGSNSPSPPADHYGSAELIFVRVSLDIGHWLTGLQGQFRASLKSPDTVLGATKYCVFKPITVSREIVEAAVRQRMERMRTERVDLLQVRLLLFLWD